MRDVIRHHLVVATQGQPLPLSASQCNDERLSGLLAGNILNMFLSVFNCEAEISILLILLASQKKLLKLKSGHLSYKLVELNQKRQP